jgi:hypothetical protein
MAQRLEIGAIVTATATERRDVIDLRCRAAAAPTHRLLSEHHETPSRPGAIVPSRGCAGSCLGRSIGSRQVMSCWSMIRDAVGHLRLSYSRQPKDPIGDSRMGFWVAAPTLIVLTRARSLYLYLCICISL